MGWWKIEGTQVIVGDAALDALNVAISEVVDAYEIEIGRRPTKEEWEALFQTVLGEDDPETRILRQGVIAHVRLEIVPK